MTIADFITRCDLYCQERGVSRVWLSKRLFSDTFKLDQLAAGSADVGVRRLEKAGADLRALVSGLQGTASGSDDGTMAPGSTDGAENSDANISRTSAAAFGHTASTHQVAQRNPIEDAGGGNSVPRAVSGAAGDAAIHHDLDQSLTGGAPAGLVQLNGAEVRQADLDPPCAADAGQGFDAQAVAVADVGDAAGEDLAGARFGGQGPPVRDARAGIGEGRSGEQAKSGRRENDSDHSRSVAPTGAAA